MQEIKISSLDQKKTELSLISNASDEPSLSDHLYLIRFLKFSKWGNILFRFLSIFPIPLLLSFLDYIFNHKIKVFLMYEKADNIKNASHVLLFKTTENKVEILQINKTKLQVTQKSKKEFLTFTFNQQRFVYEPLSKTFVSLHKSLITDNLEEFVRKNRYGLKQKNSKKLEKTWGHNELHLHYHSIKDMILEDLVSPLGIFEIFSFIVVSIEFGPFSLYAILIMFFFVRSMIFTIHNEIKVQDTIKQMAQMHSNVIVLRENRDKTFTKKIVPITDLLPGDLIEVIANMPVPADCVLVNGQCVMQESMLTGESTPILKTAYETDLPEDETSKKRQLETNKIMSRNLLHCGSEIMYTKGSLSESMLAVVIATGFYTRKGGLVQTMVDPSKKSYRFYDDAVEFLLVLLILSSISSLFYFFYKFYLAVDTIQYNTEATLIQISEIFFTIVKPSIPICLYAGIEVSVNRLTKAGVSVLNKFNLSEAAWLSVVCFDKTGTLTQDYMKMQGFLSTKRVMERINTTDLHLNQDQQSLKKQNIKSQVRRQSKMFDRRQTMMDKLGCQEGMLIIEETKLEDQDNISLNSSKLLKVFSRNLEINKDNLDQKQKELFTKKMMEIKMRRMEDQLLSLKEQSISEKQLVTIFNPLKRNIGSKMLSKGNSLFLECFGLCNSIIKIGKKIVGDPIEVEMFKNSLFSLTYLPTFRLTPRTNENPLQTKQLIKFFVPSKEAQPAVGQRLYRQMKKYEFSNKTKRMTVVSTKYPDAREILRQIKNEGKAVIADIKDLDYVYVSCKGAPESLFVLCDTDSLPEDFEERNNQLSSKGLKVLAMAGKRICLNIFNKVEIPGKEDSYQTEFYEEDLVNLEKLLAQRDVEIQKIIVEQAQDFFETNMLFLGFYVLENPLREGAEYVLRLLDQKYISSKIITGDNLFTALNVGKKVGVIGRESTVYIADIIQENNQQKCCWLQMSKFFSDVDVEEDDRNDYLKVKEIREEFIHFFENAKKSKKLSKKKKKKSYTDSESVSSEEESDMSDTSSIQSENSSHNEQAQIRRNTTIKDKSGIQSKISKAKDQSILQFKFIQESDTESEGEEEEESEKSREMSHSKSPLGEDEIIKKGPNLILTGNCFDQLMVDYLKIEDLSIMNDFTGFTNFLNEKMLPKEIKADLYYLAYSSKIFGRCDSDQKTRIINFMKAFKINPKKTLGFVGDGSNDLQAIKNADTALKLGHSDISGSTSFVSEEGDLTALLILINESKTSLANGYHNFSFMIFFVIMQFTGLINLYITGIFFNAIQQIVLDFFLLNLFGFYLPAIEPRKKLSVMAPKHSIWHKELAIYMVGQLISGCLLMTYGYYLIRTSDFYVRPEEIISEEDIHHGHIHINNYKFYDNHYVFVVTSIFSLIYLAVDNKEDHYRRGFFNSYSRIIIFGMMTLLSVFLLILPIINVEENPLLIVFTYMFRVRMIYSNQHPIVTFVSMCGVVLAFFLLSFVIKFVSQMIVYSQNKKVSHVKKIEERLMSAIKI